MPGRLYLSLMETPTPTQIVLFYGAPDAVLKHLQTLPGGVITVHDLFVAGDHSLPGLQALHAELKLKKPGIRAPAAFHQVLDLLPDADLGSSLIRLQQWASAQGMAILSIGTVRRELAKGLPMTDVFVVSDDGQKVVPLTAGPGVFADDAVAALVGYGTDWVHGL